LAKAKAQKRLLDAIEHGYDPEEEKPKRKKRVAKGTKY